MRTIRLALAQVNATVGDLDGNVQRVRAALARAREEGAALVAFPELVITGYPPEDLLHTPQVLDDNVAALPSLLPDTRGLVAVIGFVDVTRDIYNAAAVVADGVLAGVYHKQFLPNYGVFDENRYFQAGSLSPVFSAGSTTFGVNVCEDIWYPTGPTALQSFAEAELIVNINASPFHRGKVPARNAMLSTRARDNVAVIAYTNLVGGQDELVFDGNSAVFDQAGRIVAHGRAFEEDLLLAEVDLEAVFRARLHDPRRRQEKLLAEAQTSRVPRHVLPAALVPVRPVLAANRRDDEDLDEVELIRQALVLGLRDYVRKNGFSTVVLGLSGGIDSSVVAALAVDALGADAVVGVRMPSRYSSEGSLEDARLLAENLGIRLLTQPIDGMFQLAATELAGLFRAAGADHGVEQLEGIAFENLQARLRGITLMALSNQFGWLVLTTGNKSEAAAGYSTLYGDSVGAYAPIKDVPKMLVYALAEHLNARAGYDRIPRNAITKPPSAELRPNQTDQDSLPPYEELDQLIEAFVVEDRDVEELVAAGWDRATVERVMRLLYAAEFKRRQMAPGTKVTPRAFGKDRRWPITNRYRS